MFSESHFQSQDIAVAARAQIEAGAHLAAEKLYSLAADLELEALEHATPEKPRFYSSLVLSAVALMYKARRYRECEFLGYRYLAIESLLEYAREEIRDIIESARDEARLGALGRRYTGRELDFKFGGGQVGYGTAGIGAVLEQLTTQQAIARRCTEWDLGLDLRQAGLPRPEVDAIIDARVAQPSSGSYKFSIKFTEPDPSLFPELVDDSKRVERIVSRMFSFIKASADGSLEDLQKLDPPKGYLPTLLRLVRNLTPNGKSIGHVEIRQGGAEQDLPVTLTREMRPRVTDLLSQVQPKIEPKQREIFGILRALDLDVKRLSVNQDDGQKVSLRASKELTLDDVIGPMVNKRVKAIIVPLAKGARLLDIDYADVDQ